METTQALTISDVEFLNDINEYLSQLEASTVHSLQELVDWNSEHAEQALPDGQFILLPVVCDKSMN
jgi:hypothetical protein